MTDRITPRERSVMMGRIRSRDTVPELTVRKLLHRLGYRFRLHSRTLPGTPDIVLSRHRAVVLVHGCFWHRHPRCSKAYTPKSNVPFWQVKFETNVARDRRVRRELQKAGWRVLTIWECQTTRQAILAARLRRFLSA